MACKLFAWWPVGCLFFLFYFSFYLSLSLSLSWRSNSIWTPFVGLTILVFLLHLSWRRRKWLNAVGMSWCSVPHRWRLVLCCVPTVCICVLCQFHLIRLFIYIVLYYMDKLLNIVVYYDIISVWACNVLFSSYANIIFSFLLNINVLALRGIPKWHWEPSLVGSWWGCSV